MDTGIVQRVAQARSIRLSAPVYFLVVAVLTALTIGAEMWLRPAFGHSVRSVLGLEGRVEAPAGSFYATRIAPLFDEHCTGCHGERRQKGDLRLDSFSSVSQGGKQGAVVRAGNAENSELFTRMSLPPEHEKAMPPSGKVPLSADELMVVKLWIQAGASGVLPVNAIKDVPQPVRKIEFPGVDETAVRNARAPLAKAVKTWQARFPGTLTYESRSSAGLQLNASLLGASFTDDAVAELAPLGNQLVWADLSGTAVTDASAPRIAQWTRLRVLRLASTRLSDITGRALPALRELKTLTVANTEMTDSGIGNLRAKQFRVYDGKNLESDADR